MALDLEDLEGTVEMLYRLAKLDEDDVVSPTRLAVRLLGAGSVVRVPRMRAQGSLARVDGRQIIAVRAGLDRPYHEHVVGHELGHWALEREGYRGDDVELACDFIGAAIIARRRPFSRAVRATGRRWEQLALDFKTTETLVALRDAEIHGVPRAVVTPQRVYGRAPEQLALPDEHTVRRMVRAEQPGVRKARLRDDPRRVVIDFDVAEDF